MPKPQLIPRRSPPRMGLHTGDVLYRSVEMHLLVGEENVRAENSEHLRLLGTVEEERVV